MSVSDERMGYSTGDNMSDNFDRYIAIRIHSTPLVILFSFSRLNCWISTCWSSMNKWFITCNSDMHQPLKWMKWDRRDRSVHLLERGAVPGMQWMLIVSTARVRSWTPICSLLSLQELQKRAQTAMWSIQSHSVHSLVLREIRSWRLLRKNFYKFNEIKDTLRTITFSSCTTPSTMLTQTQTIQSPEMCQLKFRRNLDENSYSEFSSKVEACHTISW